MREIAIHDLSRGTNDFMDLSVLEVLGKLWRRKFLILLTIAATVLLGAFANSQLTKEYTATATVLIEPREQQIIQIESVISNLPPSLETMRSEEQVLTSRATAAAVIERLGLDKIPEFNPRLLPKEETLVSKAADWVGGVIKTAKSWAGLESGGAKRPAAGPAPLLEPEEARERRAAAQVTNRFLARQEVKILGASRVIAVSFTTENAALSQKVANAIVEEYIEGQKRLKLEAVAQANRFLGERVETLREEAERAERRVEELRAQTPVISGQDQDLVAEQVYSLRRDFVAAQIELGEATQDLVAMQEAVQTRGATAAFAGVDSAVIAQLRMEELRLRQMESELRSKFGPRHPQMVALQAQIEKQSQQIASEAGRMIEHLRDRRVAAQARVDSIKSELDDLKLSSGEINQANVGLRTLEREAEATGEVFQSFLDRYKQTEQMGYEQPDSRILSRADFPTSPSFPNARITYAVSSVVGGCLGAILVLLLELRVRGFRSAEEIEERFALPVAAVLPALRARRLTQRELGPYLWEHPNSAIAEAHKGAFASLALERRHADLGNTVMVTSSMPNEGKTLFVLGLAASLAKSGMRVLVLDCDLRASDLRRGAGVSDYVLDERPLDELVLRDVRTGAFVVSPGTPADDPLRVFRSPRLVQLVREASAKFDLVFIDTPPILAVVDAMLLAEHADQSLLVVAATRTPREYVRRSIENLRKCNARLSGIVFTKVKVGKDGVYSPSTVAYEHKSFGKYYQS